MVKSHVWCARTCVQVLDPVSDVLRAIQAVTAPDYRQEGEYAPRGWIWVSVPRGDGPGGRRQIALNVAHISSIHPAPGAGI